MRLCWLTSLHPLAFGLFYPLLCCTCFCQIWRNCFDLIIPVFFHSLDHSHFFFFKVHWFNLRFIEKELETGFALFLPRSLAVCKVLGCQSRVPVRRHALAVPGCFPPLRGAPLVSSSPSASAALGCSDICELSVVFHDVARCPPSFLLHHFAGAAEQNTTSSGASNNTHLSAWSRVSLDPQVISWAHSHLEAVGNTLCPSSLRPLMEASPLYL